MPASAGWLSAAPIPPPPKEKGQSRRQTRGRGQNHEGRGLRAPDDGRGTESRPRGSSLLAAVAGVLVPVCIPSRFGDAPFSLRSCASGSRAQQCSAVSRQQLASFSVQRDGRRGGEHEGVRGSGRRRRLKGAQCAARRDVTPASDLGPVTPLFPPSPFFPFFLPLPTALPILFFTFPAPFLFRLYFLFLEVGSLPSPSQRAALFYFFFF